MVKKKASKKENLFTAKRKPITIIERNSKAIQKDARKKKNENRIGKVQAKKSTGRMPWHRKPMKDVTSCDKLR